MQYKLKSSLNKTLLTTMALCSIAPLAHSQVKPGNNVGRAIGGVPSIPGELIMQCQTGTAQADVTRLAKLVGAAQTIPLLRADCYQLVLDSKHLTVADAANAIAVLKLDPMVKTAVPNYIFTTHQSQSSYIPNDPRYKTGEQYGLALINMPQAWPLQQGDVNTTIAVLDSGFDPTHEDSPTFHQDSYNATNGTKKITFNSPANGVNDHGVGTSGVFAAKTNNGKGIAGVVWNRVPVLAVKGFDDAGNPFFSNATLINGYTYIANHAAADNIKVLNLSLGANGLVLNAGDPQYDALRSVYDAGVNVIASAGNSGPGTISFPAVAPWVISVSATGNTKTALSPYSSDAKVDITAPGGDQSTLATNGILLLQGGGTYTFEEGTSFAAPHTTGVMALLRSVSNVGRDEAQTALLTQADSTSTKQTSVPAPQFGWGYLDAYKSIKKVSYTLNITSPIGIDPATGQSTSTVYTTPAPLQTLRPRINLHMRGVSISGGVPQFTVQVTTGSTTQNLITNGVVDPSAVDANGSLISDLYIVNQTVGSLPEYTVSFRYRATDTPVSQQQQLTATYTPNDPTITVTPVQVNYNITPYSFPSGISMVSFPVVETFGDSPDPTKAIRDIRDILGLTQANQSAVLYRWVNVPTVDATGQQGVQGAYATYGIGNSGDYHPELATLHPSDVTTVPSPTFVAGTDPTNPNNTVTNASPAGLAYFLKLSSGAAVRSFGRTFETQTIQVPIHEGWNMIGNPFTFPIAFSNLSLQTANGTRYPIPDAATNKLILPFIYRFVGGQYTFQALPNGTLYPWEGNWIYVIPTNPNSVDTNVAKYTLNMPPTQAGLGTRGTRPATYTNSRATAALANKPTVRGAGSWVLQLAARTATSADTFNFIGMSSDAATNPSVTRALKPPMLPNSVAVGITSDTSKATYAQDIRPTGAAQTWNVTVTPDKPNTQVSVTWPNVHTLPRNYQLTLTDPSTNQSVDLRTRSVYTFNSGANGASRNLVITATPGQVQDSAQFNSVVVTPRGTGKGTAAVYQIDYQMTGTAQVDVSILGNTGTVIAQVDSGRATGTGENHVVWNGRDNQGRTLATGNYTVRLRAVTASGKVSQYRYPLIITR